MDEKYDKSNFQESLVTLLINLKLSSRLILQLNICFRYRLEHCLRKKHYRFVIYFQEVYIFEFTLTLFN